MRSNPTTVWQTHIIIIIKEQIDEFYVAQDRLIPNDSPNIYDAQHKQKEKEKLRETQNY